MSPYGSSWLVHPRGEVPEARTEDDAHDGGCGILSRSHSAADVRLGSMRVVLLGHQDAGDRGGHEADERPGEKGPEPEPGEVGLARRREAADAADLDADGREVREAAQRERRDDLALLGEAATTSLNIEKAKNSLMTVLFAMRLPIVAASCAGAPRMRARGS